MSNALNRLEIWHELRSLHSRHKKEAINSKCLILSQITYVALKRSLDIFIPGQMLLEWSTQLDDIDRI
jgi:hypothetical protein